MGGGGLTGSDFDPTSSSFAGGYGNYVDPMNMGGRSNGGKGGKNAAPQAPDFNAAAETQARTSRNDVNSAFGGASWQRTPDGRWALSMNMAPELQAASQRLMGQVGQASNLDPAAAREQAISAAYDQSASRLDPRFAQRQSALEAQLANEGFSRGDAGWQTATGNLDRERTDAYQQAMYGAQTGAGNAAFNQSLLANRQAATLPLEQLASIRGLGEGAGLASLSQAQPVQALNAAMNQYGGELQQYGINQANKNSMMQALPLLAAAL